MSTVCNLPGGYFEGAALHREAELIELGGREEELLADRSASSTAARITQILCRCVTRIGTIRPITEEVARRLLIGDRLYLLLKLREITVGDRVEGTVGCPWPDCGAKVDIDFSTADLPVRPCEDRSPTYTIELSAEAWTDEGAGVPRPTLTFRLPDGGDQEELSTLLAHNPAAALTALFDRCVLNDARRSQAPAFNVDFDASRLSARGRIDLEHAMEARAPSVSLDLALACPECGRGFSVPFDLQDFFFGELRTSRDLLRRQVHYLAYHYHWSEREILDMPRDKRLSYIEILADEIEALNNAV